MYLALLRSKNTPEGIRKMKGTIKYKMVSRGMIKNRKTNYPNSNPHSKLTNSQYL